MNETTEITTTHNPQDFSQQLREQTTAVRVRLSKFGTRRTLSSAQKNRAAQPFDARGKAISASKRLIDTSAPEYRAVTSRMQAIVDTWKRGAVAYPEEAVRLMKTSYIDEFRAQVEEAQRDVDRLTEELNRIYPHLRQQASQDLGELHDPEDYPETLRGAFTITVDYPAITPDERLARLHPELYQREQEKISARFTQALADMETALAEELSDMIEHLQQKMSGLDDGTAKRFHSSTVDNLTHFFHRFRELSIGSNDELETLVDQTQEVMQGISPRDVRAPGFAGRSIRQTIREGMTRVSAQLDGLLVDRPRRQISFDDE